MTLYEKTREYIQNKSYIPVKPEELYETFKNEAGVAEFNDTLQALIDDGLVAYIKKGKVTSTESAGYLRGIFRSNAKGFGFFIPDEEYRKRTGGDLYISADNTLNAVNDDIVLALMTSEAKPDDTKGGEGRIVKIIEHQMKNVIGTLREIASLRKRGTPRYYIKPDDRRLNFLINIDESINAPLGSKVEVEITQYPTKLESAHGKITSVFGDSDSSEANYAAILHECGIKTSFDPATLEEAAKVSQRTLSTEGRLDLRGKTIMTIDGADAKDLDDAVSVEKNNNGYTLGVHIADVADYVADGSALDSEAFERGTSVYFTDRVVPMLPECISNGCCSLNAGEDKYTLSALIEVDNEGEIRGCEIHEAIIRTAVRGVYTEVNDVLANGRDSNYYDKYKPVADMLPVMTELYNILDEKSKRRGALELETVEAKIVLENGRPVDIIKIDRGISEKLIEQFMLCANEAVANWLFWQDMPCVYRIHEDPSPEKIHAFALFAHNLGLNTSALRAKKIHSAALEQILEQAKGTDTDTTVSYMLLRSLMKARYSATCSPHFGLAIEKYCHFTSPIRRYPDLSVHRIVKSVLHGNANGSMLSHLTTFAEKSANKSSENEIKAVTAERAIEDMYRIIYMADHIGETYDGIVSTVMSFGLFVELENTCEGMVPISSLDGYFNYDERAMTLSCGYTVYSLGKRVKVTIESADIISRRIEMRIVVPDER